MPSHFFVLGSHPQLSLAEAKAVIGGAMPKLVGPVALFSQDDWDGAWLQERLAGVVKLGDILFSCPAKDLFADQIVDALPKREGTNKLTFAVTVHGSAGTSMRKLPIELKKALKRFQRSIRWFADEAGEVSPAAVSKLGLTTDGYDIMVLIESGIAHVGITTHVQDLDAWSLRDYGRPARDSRNGMLPPKLARMMINIGMGAWNAKREALNVSNKLSILDPFCGSGTVLMEASLMLQQAKVIGSDIEEKQVADTHKNLDWMVEKHLISDERRQLITCFPHDVRTIHNTLHEPIDLVITEGFLGTPLRGHEPAVHLDHQVRIISALWREALTSLGKVQPSGGIVVGIWPSLETPHAQATVDLTSDVEELGYTLLQPLEGWLPTKDLVYARTDQHVRRRIVVLRKK